MKVVHGDILKIRKGMICHQVNCQGKMGAGIALQIKNKWPRVYKAYKEGLRNGLLTLGGIQFIDVTPTIWVCNMAAQDRYGRDKRYTDYGAFAQCLLHIKAHRIVDTSIYFPYKIGCVNAGGDWTTVKALISDIIPDARICMLP